MNEFEGLSEDPKDLNTPLLTTSEVQAWRDELELLVEELRTKNLRADWLRRRLIAAQVLIDAQREEAKK
jgi:regulator of replication initiation timing